MHDDLPIDSVPVSINGRLAMSCSQGGMVKAWNVASLREGMETGKQANAPSSGKKRKISDSTRTSSKKRAAVAAQSFFAGLAEGD